MATPPWLNSAPTGKFEVIRWGVSYIVHMDGGNVDNIEVNEIVDVRAMMAWLADLANSHADRDDWSDYTQQHGTRYEP